MILIAECIVLCIIFTLIILPAQYKDPMVMIMSYPPNVIKRVEQLPQYAGCIKERKKKHISKKIFGVFFFAVLLAIVAYFSGCREFADTFFHVFMLFFVVNIYDMLVLDWGIFCHSKKLRIQGTEDMDKDYKDYLFHAKGAAKGTVVGIIVAILSGIIMEMSRNVQSGNTQNLKSSAVPVRLPAAPAPTPGTSQAAAPAGCAYRS